MPPSSIEQQQPDRATPWLDAALPRRRPDNSAKLRVELAALRGMLTARQITLLDRHQRLLEDYSHLLQLYIAPHDCLNLDALPEADRQVYIARIRRTALNLLLPTERDTLANAIKTLTATVAATVQLQRTVACLPTKEWDEEIDSGEQLDLSRLSTSDLIKIKEGMELLRCQPQRQRECPTPPRPEPIDDLCSPFGPRSR
jgi:hypothetical protein